MVMGVSFLHTVLAVDQSQQNVPSGQSEQGRVAERRDLERLKHRTSRLRIIENVVMYNVYYEKMKAFFDL